MIKWFNGKNFRKNVKISKIISNALSIYHKFSIKNVIYYKYLMSTTSQYFTPLITVCHPGEVDSLRIFVSLLIRVVDFNRVEIATRNPDPVLTQWVTTQIIEPDWNALGYNPMSCNQENFNRIKMIWVATRLIGSNFKLYRIFEKL